MPVQTAAGSRLYIGTTATVVATDTFIEVGDITNLGQFGRSYNEIKFESLGNRNTLKFKGQRDDGDIQLDLGFSNTNAGQAALKVALDVDANYNFKVTLNDAITPNIVSTVTVTIASPGVFTMSGSAPIAGTPVVLATTGALPTGLTAGTTYYVLAPSGSTFQLAATVGGSAIVTSGSQSGVHTATLSPGAPTTFTFKANVMGYQTTVGTTTNIVTARVMLGIASGTIVETLAV